MNFYSEDYYSASLGHINPCPINFLVSHKYSTNLVFCGIYIRKNKNNKNKQGQTCAELKTNKLANDKVL